MAGSPSTIRAGRAFVELFTDSTKLTAGLLGEFAGGIGDVVAWLAEWARLNSGPSKNG